MSLEINALDAIADKVLSYHPPVERHAIGMRNRAWRKNNDIPSWVNIEDVGLDQFFTRPAVAKDCFKSFVDYIKANDKIERYEFIEPAAGLGAFYDLLPRKKRTGIDVVRFRPEFIQKDFLSWFPIDDGRRNYVCIGNPPFGYRAWLALAFLNHAALFSDYVGFIIPMAFQSEGKGNHRNRVKGLHLVHSSHLPHDSFVSLDGKIVKVNALWQIWSRKGIEDKTIVKTCDQFIDLFTVDNRKERRCGQERKGAADFFIQRTFYHEPPDLVTSFTEVKYVCGYGIIIKRDREKVLQILRSTDWRKYSNLTAHNCRHISMCHIRKTLTDGGLVDV